MYFTTKLSSINKRDLMADRRRSNTIEAINTANGNIVTISSKEFFRGSFPGKYPAPLSAYQFWI